MLKFWAPLLAKLFTHVGKHGKLPRSQTQALVKLDKLSLWKAENNILGLEQAGFRLGRSGLDHCLVLSHLISKHILHYKAHLNAAFLDLRAAFDSIDRTQLWKKLDKTRLDKRLPLLIGILHSQTSSSIKVSAQGHLSAPILINTGVKQGCVLTPMPLNLLINNLAPILFSLHAHYPQLGSLGIPLLLCADDLVLLSRTRTGLSRLVLGSIDYLPHNNLHLNFGKSKIVAFAKTWKPSAWIFKGHVEKQVKEFKYLGVNFHFRHAWTSQCSSVIHSINLSIQAIMWFLFPHGGTPVSQQRYRHLNAISRWYSCLDNSF